MDIVRRISYLVEVRAVIDLAEAPLPDQSRRRRSEVEELEVDSACRVHGVLVLPQLLF